MREKMGMTDPAATEELCTRTYHEAGTTKAGLVVRCGWQDPGAAHLQLLPSSRNPLSPPGWLPTPLTPRSHQAAGYAIDAAEWHAVAHGRLDYARHLPAEDPRLRALLRSIPVPVFLFTNGDDAHAAACLARLGIADCFAGVLTYETLQAAGARLGTVAPGRVLCKPAPASFLTALALAGGVAPSRALFLDDSPRNIAGAAAAGLAAVLVGSPVRCPGALAALQDVRELRAVVPQLWSEPAPKAAYEAAPVEELAVSG